MLCERSITFTIPGKHGGIEITAVERDGNLVFTVESGGRHKPDLRGLFLEFDESKLSGLSVDSSDPRVKRTKISANDVLRGHDDHHGHHRRGHDHDDDRRGRGHDHDDHHGHHDHNPYDIGVFFGDPKKGHHGHHGPRGPIEFTLDGVDDLTLDDLAHMKIAAQIGDNKIVKTCIPAAPDARDDSYTIFEDGQAGLTSPSPTAQGVVFQLLENDTDADGDKLKIIRVGGAEHGTVTIIDGDDADTRPGDAVLYTPDADYSGPDSFTYKISDRAGGKDSATVNIMVEAVADAPEVAYEIVAGGAVNEIIIKVTAKQTDADGSEFIDRIELGDLPPGATVVPGDLMAGGEPGTVTQEFKLILPMDQDTNFDLGITAYSKEMSNGDEESATVSAPILLEYSSTTVGAHFAAIDQSMWNTGDEFTFTDDRFIGIDTGDFNESIGSTFYAGVSGHIKLGLQSTLTFEGGEIDANADYDVTVETNYNKTTDELLIDTSALLTGASFNTEGPSGSYFLGFLYDVLLQAYAGVNIDLGLLGSINEQIDFPTVEIGPGTATILDVDSDTLGGTITLPSPLNAFSINYDWPDISTSGSFPPNPVVSSGASNNFVELNLDVDELLTDLLGLPVNPLNPSIDLGIVYANLDLLDVDVVGGLNFLQQFDMAMGDLVGVLSFEDGSSQIFEIGDSLPIHDASSIDAAGDADGVVEFVFDLAPRADLTNDTELGFNIGANVSVFSVELGYDIGIASDSVTLGPLAGFGGTLPVGSVSVFDQTFALNFGNESFAFAA